MTEQELQALAADRPAPGGIIWSEHVYGLGRWLKRHAGVPDELPLCAQIDHGPSNWEVPHKMDLESKAPVLLFHHEKSVAATLPFVSKPCLVMGSPFVHCRRINGFQVARDAQGTLAIPTHTTHHGANDIDWRRYCEDLRGIPEAFQPVTVCLYWKEILSGLHKVFQSEGFPVVSAGHMYDPEFTERFYRILARHRYLTSNETCTAAFYALEMGLPFFVWGEQEFSNYNSGGEPAYPKGKYVWKDLVAHFLLGEEDLEDLPAEAAVRLRALLGRRVASAGEFLELLRSHAGIPAESSAAAALMAKAGKPFGRPWDRKPFRQPGPRVTLEQKAFVSHYLGLHSAIPPRYLRAILWQASEVMNFGKPAAALEETCRKALEPAPAEGRQPCPACGSFESIARQLAATALPSAAGVFEVCRDCGSAFRSLWALDPPVAPRSASMHPAGSGLRELTGLESAEQPLGSLAEAKAVPGGGRLRVSVPALGGVGLEAFGADSGIRILFTVTGLRHALARSGWRTLSAWQDETGMLRAIAEPGGPERPVIIKPPWDSLEGLTRLLARGRGGPRGGAEVFAPVFELARQDLGAREKEAFCLRLFDLIRNHPQPAPLLKAMAIMHLGRGELAQADQWLGLCSEYGSLADHPREELVLLHERMGFDPAVRAP